MFSFLFFFKLFLALILPLFIYRYTKKRLIPLKIRTEKDYAIYMSVVQKIYQSLRHGELNATHKLKNKKKKYFYYTMAFLLLILCIHDELDLFNTYLTQTLSFSNDTAVESETDIVLHHCLSSQPLDILCTINTTYWWRHKEATVEHERRYFMDRNEELLFTTLLDYPNIIYPFERESPKNNVALLRESHLIGEVSNLAQMNPNKCICNVFLGIMDNIIFLNHRERNNWILLYDAYIYRSISLSQKIESKPSFPGKWQLYEESVTHGDRFLVSFRTISLKNNNNRHLLESFIPGHKDIVPLLRLEKNKTDNELILQLDGIDAICFIHCQRLFSTYKNIRV